MSYYSDLDDDLGATEEAEEHHREYEHEQRQKKKSFDNAVAAEVKKQLAKLNVKPVSKIDFIVNHKNKKQVSSGLKKEVSCKCCHRPFMARVADLNRGWGKFCSKSCKAKKQESQTGQFKAYLTRSLR